MTTNLAAPRTDALRAVAAPRRYPDEITAVLLERIDAGVYPPGSKLPSTRELAEAFEVSQPIVREALSRLKYDGIVEPRQGSGVWVLSRLSTSSLRLDALPRDARTPDELRRLADTFEMRLHVEASCAGLAAERRTRQDLAQLHAALRAMADAVAQRRDGTAADVRFHVGIAAATHNDAMRKLVEYLHGTMAASVEAARRNSDRVAGHPEAAQAEHQAVYAAIKAGDAAGAAAAVRTHLQNAAQRLGLQGAVAARRSGARR